MEKKKKVFSMHPNSLANLHQWTPEEARIAQLKGMQKRKENAIKRRRMKEDLQLWKSLAKDVAEEGVSGIETLKVLLARAIYDDDLIMAADLATKLAEYEKPKLARQEVKVEETVVETLTDQEIEARLKQYANK